MSFGGTQRPPDAPQQMARGSDEIRVPEPATSPHTWGSSEASTFSRGHAPALGPGAGAAALHTQLGQVPAVLLTGLLALQNQLSGNLLRKFKNSNGWQKLWVVFTNFCLFFYKSHQVSATHRVGGSMR